VLVDGAGLVADAALLTVCPWWDGPQTRQKVDRQLAADAASVGDRMWVWVYHAPPEPSPTSWTGRRHYGDTDLTQWIEHHRPAVVLCGHVHQAPFASAGTWIDRIGTTAVFNAGRQRGPIPTRVEIDTAAREASWFSLVGAETDSFA
jgi:Icc-related predicted phosphoesterase